MIIKNHKDLKSFIEGKNILHLNSLGKDSVVCLEWLTKFANPSKIVSVWFRPMACHPKDEMYINYLAKRYPSVEFIEFPNPFELSDIAMGEYQCPIKTMNFINHFEFESFDFKQCCQDVLKSFSLDYICDGTAKYESVTRATNFHKKGIVQGNKIYPIGMMSKKEVINIIKECRIKLHPCYKIVKSTFDHPSYYKMRSAFILSPEYKKLMYKIYPMLELDEFRYEEML